MGDRGAGFRTSRRNPAIVLKDNCLAGGASRDSRHVVSIEETTGRQGGAGRLPFSYLPIHPPSTTRTWPLT